MIVQVSFQPPKLYEYVHELIRMAYPKAEIIREETGDIDLRIFIAEEHDQDQVSFWGWIEEKETRTQHQQQYSLVQTNTGVNEINRCARRFAYNMLTEHTSRSINSYGILTGMRPVKLVHSMLDNGLTDAEIRLKLTGEFRISPEKAGLLLEVAGNNHPYLLKPQDIGRIISLYIGIPFCPTRCYYCSFPGGILKERAALEEFLSNLHKEMHAVAECLRELNMEVQTIYIGGGTPTVLSEAELSQLFDDLHKWFISSATSEITVEAGRPDTLWPGKLALLKQAGTDRICINPQTMNDHTLVRIGRGHDQEGVVQSVHWAKEVGFKQVNMDLIVGLPGEGSREFQHTAEEILKLSPENITVHTLAVKKGSALAEVEGRETVGDRVSLVQQGLQSFADQFRCCGYQPYYLYRQKYMQASMENVGYSQPGHFCLYNMQMIEERQMIIGLGGGAASKFINPSDGSLRSFYNPKNPEAYVQSLPRLIAAKVDNLRAVH